MYVYAIEGDSARYTQAQAIARIDELSGRNIGSYIVRTAIPASARDRRNGYRASAYVSRNGPGGFKVRRELAYARTDAALVSA
jgi:hypothetical protein